MRTSVFVDRTCSSIVTIYGSPTALREILAKANTSSTIAWSNRYHEHYITMEPATFERWSATRVYTDPTTGYHVELIHTEEGYYFVRVVELEGCMSDGDTETEARANILEAMELWLEIEREDGCTIPTPAA